MIKSFACKHTERLFNDKPVRKWNAIERLARRKMTVLHAAISISSLRVPPGNRLEKLSGNRKGQWSIRINDRWRVCFVWENGHALNVEIVDYH